MLKVLIANDQPIIRRGIRQILLEEFSFVQMEEVTVADALLNKIRTTTWDLVLVDLAIPGIIETLQQVTQEAQKLPVLVLSSGPEQHYAMKVINQGAAGCINKDTEAVELIKAVKLVLTGKKYIPATISNSNYTDSDKLPHEKLSDRELHVLRLLAAGKTVAEIGRLLSLQSNTISTYRSRLLNKMNMKTNVDILRYAMEHNLL